MAKSAKGITTSSTAEYFAKNLQQVGFSSPTKAVLTTVKEAVDNALDACEEHGILPEISIYIEKLGAGHIKNTDRILIRVEDNGPGIDISDVPMVFGEYLASSKFGRGRCSRGQQGIGISAATTWAIQTTAQGARVVTKQKGQRKAVKCVVATDLKKNKGIVQDKESIEWEKPHGTSVEFVIDGRVQLNGEAGLLNYIRGNILLNPHMTLHYTLPEVGSASISRVSNEVPIIPEATAPHPHTMKLGEFISHARLYGGISVKEWFKKGFSRISDNLVAEILANGKLPASFDKEALAKVSDEDFQKLFAGVQNTKLMAPPTSSVMSIGEEALALSIKRLGDMDFFSVVSRTPVICDFKPVQVEVAVARTIAKGIDPDSSVQVLRFANRVPLQFDKASCAIVKAISNINWKAYGLKQSKNQLPTGPYVVAVSVVSPFIKFKNASKETIDASDDLVEEIRRALMKAGQQLSRHLNREHKASELDAKIQHIEKFSPILVATLCRILKAPESRRSAAEDGLKKILARDSKETEKQLSAAEERLLQHLEGQKQRFSSFKEEDDRLNFEDTLSLENEEIPQIEEPKKKAKKKAKEEVIEDDESEDVEEKSDKANKPKKSEKVAPSTKKVGAKKVVKKTTQNKKKKTKK